MGELRIAKKSALAACIALSVVAVGAAAEPPLITAIRAGRTDTVRALLQKKVDVNATQGDGATPLHWAVHLDDLVTADLLLKAGAKVNIADDTGVTPLYLSCMNRRAAMVERLLAAGADPNAALLNGETALMMCARAGDPASVKALLLGGANVNAKESRHHQTALMWAASEKRPEVVKLLIEVGADINARSVIYPRTVTGEETQRAGREELNYTVLRGGSTPLLFAAREGDVESARLLLAAGADVNDKLPDGTTALIEAAHSGQGAVAALLLDKGADPNNADIGYTALHAAVLRGDRALVKALLAHKANPNAVMTKATQTKRANGHEFELLLPMLGSTPYMLASQYLETEMMRVLAAAGADTGLPKKDGMTPLMLAVGMMASIQVDRRSHRVLDGAKVEDEPTVLEGVKTALALGADVNAVNQQGDTALHSAAAQGFNSVIQLLVDHGAHLSVKNKRGLTPLSVALTGAGQGRAAAAAGATDPDQPNFPQSTMELLKKLGAE
jgi:ankyrin repeat protein